MLEGDALVPKHHVNDTSDGQDYMASSPHAGYDSKRMERMIQNKIHEAEKGTSGEVQYGVSVEEK